MATITIRVPDDLKERMDEVEENWSQVLRDAIDERLRNRRRSRLADEMDRNRAVAFRRTGRHADLSGEVLRWRRRH